MSLSHDLFVFIRSSQLDSRGIHFKRSTTTASELGMSEDKETPLGVKMLADHLVKVKMQYEGGIA